MKAAPPTTRIAVIGTSNIGALKYAAPAIAADHPQLAVTFYGLPGGKFAEARVTQTSFFQPLQSDRGALKLAQRINGSAAIDLAAFDHVLVIADTLGMPATLWTATGYDIADWPTRRTLPLLSEPAFMAAMTEAITTRADHLRAQFGTLPLHVALAPYPTTAVVPPGPHHQQPYAAMASHPEAARIETLYRTALTDALRDRAMTLIPQPPETVAQPFLTVESYGHGSLDFRRPGSQLNDHRHMNADFGTSLFAAFALTLPQMALAPTPQTQGD